MPNAVSFQSYPSGPSPSPQAVGALLAQKSAAHAAGLDADTLGGGGDALSGARGMTDAASDLLSRGSAPMGGIAATGGDHTGTPGVVTPTPPFSAMSTQAASNPVTRPELETSDNMYDPTMSHSASATATALDEAMTRTQGRSSGIGKVQNQEAGSPFQRLQLQKMGLSPIEIDLLAHGGGVKGL